MSDEENLMSESQSEPDFSASEEEWVPEKVKSQGKRGKGKTVVSESEESEDESALEEDDDDDSMDSLDENLSEEENAPKRKRGTGKKSSGGARKRPKREPGKSKTFTFQNKHRKLFLKYKSPTKPDATDSGVASTSLAEILKKSEFKTKKLSLSQHNQSDADSRENTSQTKQPLKSRNIDDSDSESSVDDYLVKPDQLDLNSDFFKPTSSVEHEKESKANDQLPNFDCSGGVHMSDESVFDEMEALPIDTIAKTDDEKKTSATISMINRQSSSAIDLQENFKFNQELESTKEQLKKMQGNKFSENDEAVNVEQLLMMGEEGTTESTVKIQKSKRAGEQIGRKRKKLSQDSDSDWEDVEIQDENASALHSANPGQPLQITVELPGHVPRQKKEVDVEACIKRRLNFVKKENQVYIHKVHVLAWIAHGNRVNCILNDTYLYKLCLKSLPGDRKQCYPKDKTDIKYYERITKWYQNEFKLLEQQMYSSIKKLSPLATSLALQIKDRKALCKRDYAFIFIILLRAMGFECRMVFNLTTVPLRPPKTELHKVAPKKLFEKYKSPEKENQKGPNNETTSLEELKKNRKEPEIKEDPKPAKKSRKASTKQSTAAKTKISTSKDSKEADATPVQAPLRRSARQASTSSTNSSKAEDNSTTQKRSQRQASTSAAKDDQISKTKPKKDDKAGLNIEQIDGSTDIARPASRSTRRRPPDENSNPSQSSSQELPPAKKTKPNSQPSRSSSTESPFQRQKPRPAASDSGTTKSHSQVEPSPRKTRAQRAAASHSQELKNDSSSSQAKKKLDAFAAADKKKLYTSPKPSTSQQQVTPPQKIVKQAQKPKSKLAQNSSKTAGSSKLVSNDETQKKPTAKKSAVNKNKKIAVSVSLVESNSDDDFIPVRKHSSGNSEKVMEAKKVSFLKRIDRRVLSTDNEEDPKKNKKNAMDLWIEVYAEEEKRWITIDVFKGTVDCVDQICHTATSPIAYVLAWNNDNTIKDVSPRYCEHWNTTTRKLRAEKEWFDETLRPYLGKSTARDKAEDKYFEKIHSNKPKPTAIADYKNHPLYALERHLLKFEALYPPDVPPIGWIRKEPIYPRDCVFTLHTRDKWYKEARVVKLHEEPYKIVTARPTWDRVTKTVIKDRLLELFGVWQTKPYEPPTAENGLVPRNAYGNVELFKPEMLPKKTVHLKLAGLNRVCKRLGIDCAPAVVGFDFHSGSSHPVYEGFVICEEFAETVTDAWIEDQDEQERKEREKREKRVYDNWKRLIKGLMIRARLKRKYNFGNEEEDGANEEEPQSAKKKSVFKKLKP